MNLDRSRTQFKMIVISIPFLFLTLQACTIQRSIDPTYLDKIICTKPYQVGSIWYQPTIKTKGFEQKGIASWYGKQFHGRKTSNGEVYNMHTMTAAHKTLPLNCWVRVLNLNNNKWVNVRINDRGPFIKNRVIDLSYAAAERISIIDEGIVEVKITYLGEIKMTQQGLVYIQPHYQISPLAI